MTQLSGEALMAEITRLRAELEAAKAAKATGTVSQTHVAGTTRGGNAFDGYSVRQGSMNVYVSKNAGLWLADLIERGTVTAATIRAAINAPAKAKK